MTATPQTIDNILADPDNAIKILTALKDERQKNLKLLDQNRAYQSEHKRLLNLKMQQDKIIEEQAPKAAYTDMVLLSESTYTTTQIAKDLGMGAPTLNKKLYDLGVQYNQSGQWVLYSRFQSKGYTKTRTYTYECSDGTIRTTMLTVWTEKGRAFIYYLIKNS